MTKYEIVIHCFSKELSTILPVLEGSCQIITLKQVGPDTPAARQRIGPRYANGVRNKGISGDALMLEILSKTPMSLKQISTVFKQRGFAEKTASPILSKLTKAKKVTRMGSGSYTLTGGK
jgi:hypothetical protein